MTFEQWMKDQDYQPSTVSSTLRMVRKAEEVWAAGGVELDTYRQDIRRYVTWLGTRGVPERILAGTAFTLPVEAGDPRFATWALNNYEPLTPNPVGAPQEGEALDQEAWDALIVELSEDTAVNRVLKILIGLPYPAQELRITLEEPLEDLKRQLPPPYLPTLKKIRATNAETLQVYLAGEDSYEAAYKQIQRRLTAIGESIGRSLNMRDIGATGWELRFAAALEAP